MATAASRKKSIISNHAMQIDSPVANTNMALNKSAASSTSLYQQCSQLRARLLRIKEFSEFFKLASPTGSARQSTDPVTQLWDIFSLGVPLCFLFNLLPPPATPIETDTSPYTCDVSDLKVRKRAIALFTMKARKGVPDGEPFTVTELTDRHSSHGLVKVVNTVTLLVDMLPDDRFVIVTDSPANSVNDSTDSLPTEAPLDAKEAFRNHTIKEIVETERKFVADLEALQRYANALAQGNVISQDTIHLLFPGLNKLLNFQRTFLIKLEATAEAPWKDQRWGQHFIETEEEFAVYEPYCANYVNATELMLAEAPSLSTLNHIINVPNELGAFLIKPIQRICKYPLLLEGLLKGASADTYPHYEELQLGYAASRRVTDTINEAQRRAENIAAVRNLEHRVEDWKGHNLANFGELLLDSVFRVTKSDVDRDYHVFLFEKIILCCKEAPVLTNGKKLSKSNSYISRSKSTPITPSDTSKDKTPLLLKGRIFLNNVTQAVPAPARPGAAGSTVQYPYSLSVYWRGDDDLEFFTLRCRSEEQMKQWETAINKLIQAAAIRRAAERNTSNGMQKAETILKSRDPVAWQKTVDSMDSTRRPLSAASSAMTGSHSPSMSSARFRNHMHESSEEHIPASASYGGIDDGFDVEPEDEFEDYPPTSAYPVSGRGTPMASRRMNAQSMPAERDAYSSQWRSQSPIQPPSGGQPLPPGGPRPMAHRLTSDASFGPGVRTRQTTSLRHQISASKLKHDGGSQRIMAPMSAAPVLSQPPLIRSRSSSQPTAYNPGPQPSHAIPPVPVSSGPGGSDDKPAGKRGSNSSQSTDESTDYSPPNSSSPITPFGSSDSAIGAVGLRTSRSQTFEKQLARSNAQPVQFESLVKVKVHYFDNLFVIQVPRNTQYAELAERVSKKIRLCGRRQDEGPFRVKYQDEDGDMVSLGSTEDVQMAFEQYQPGGQVSLFVT